MAAVRHAVRHAVGQTGNALLVTMIAIAVLMVLVVGAIRFTGTNREAAAAKMRGDQVSACAEVARKYLLSRLKATIGTSSSTPTLGNLTLVDAVKPADRSVISAAHYNGPASAQAVDNPNSSLVSGSSKKIRDLANSLPSSTTSNGTYWRVVVKCTEPNSVRESEVEFLFLYGG